MTEEARALMEITCHGLDAGWGQGAVAAANGPKRFPLPGDRPTWGRDRPIEVEHVRLEFGFDLRRRSLTGVTTTTFRPRHDGLAEIAFDAIELAVESVTDGDGRDLDWRTGDRSLRVDLGSERPAGIPITTVVRYAAKPRRGLYFNAPEPAYPDRPQQIWTQGQAEDSAYYFPCFDFPGEKFTTEVLATVPASWFALSNGRLHEVSEDRRRRTKTYHWKQEQPHPAYLVTLAAGEFDEVTADADGVPVQYYGPKGSAADLERAFGRTPEMVRFFVEKIGVPYPWPKYGTVAIHDFIFGGMENTSATTMTDTLLHDERAHPDFVETADSITAHELAHQWFGDLLTCREWSHGWLNESFATYFDALFVEHHRGWDAFRYAIRGNAKRYQDEDAQSYRRPLVENIYREPIDIFDRHLYERGSVVLDMLRTELGDDVWWRAINHYTSKHRESDVITHDFQRAIEESTGRNMDAFFDQWVWKGGHPELKATYAWDGKQRLATVSVEQTQEPDETLTSIYRAPLEIGFQVNGAFERHTVRLTERQHAFVFRLDAEPDFVSIDPAGKLLKTLDFSPGEAQLKARLQRDPEAIGRIEAAGGLAKLGSPGAIDALKAALLDSDELDFVRAEAATALGEVRSAAARDALIEAARTEPSRVRHAIATALGNYRDDEAARVLDAYLARRGDASYYVQSAAAAALGRTLQPRSYRSLTRVLGRPAHNDVITAGALTGLGALRDPRAVDVLLDHTQWGTHQGARAAACAALGALHPFTEQPARTRIRERLEDLLDDRWLRVQLAAVGALQAIADPRSVGRLRATVDRALDGRLLRSCRVAAGRVAERADKGDEIRALKDEVEKLRQANQQLSDRLVKMEARLDGGDGSSDGANGRDGRTPRRQRSRRSTRTGR